MTRNKNINTTIIDGAKFLQKENTQLKIELDAARQDNDYLTQQLSLLKVENEEHAPKEKFLREETNYLKKLLHDLTPGGSEFYNEPEICFKWIKENRDESASTYRAVIKDLKKLYSESKVENERLKEALNECKDFLHVLPMLRLGNKQGFDECVDIEGVKKLEVLCDAALNNIESTKNK